MPLPAASSAGVVPEAVLHPKSRLTGALIGVAVGIGIEGETEFGLSRCETGRMSQQESIAMPIAIPTPRGVSVQSRRWP